MNLIVCKNGHRYDPDLTPDCPECARLQNDFLTEEVTDGGPAPAWHGTVVTCERGHRYDPTLTRECPECAMGLNGPMVHQEELDLWDPVVTQRVAPRNLAGWLVCIDGPDKGSDFRLYYDNNYVGRDSSNEICIPLDPLVSRHKHCVITYDWVEGMFYIGLSGGRAIIRLNGKPVLTVRELKRDDRIQIGSGTYRFVPFCDGDFQWD